MIDLNKPGLTDVSDWRTCRRRSRARLRSFPSTKTLFVDLLEPAYKIDATRTIKDVIAEKIEGLAWGPDLPDGRHVLYVISDNDLFSRRCRRRSTPSPSTAPPMAPTSTTRRSGCRARCIRPDR